MSDKTCMIVPLVLDGGVYSRPWAFQLWFEHSQIVAFQVEFSLLAMHWILVAQLRKAVYSKKLQANAMLPLSSTVFKINS